MAEIQVERTKKSSATARVIIFLVIVALLGAGWFFMMGPGAGQGADMTTPAVSEPQSPPPPAGLHPGSLQPLPQEFQVSLFSLNAPPNSRMPDRAC